MEAPPPATDPQPEYTSLVTDGFRNVTDAEEDAFASRVPAPMPKRLRLPNTPRLHDERPSGLLLDVADGNFRRREEPVTRGVSESYFAEMSRPLVTRDRKIKSDDVEDAAEKSIGAPKAKRDAHQESAGGGTVLSATGKEKVPPPVLSTAQIVAIVCSALLVSTVGGAVVYKHLS